MRPFLPYAKPHLDDTDRQAVVEVLTTDQLTRGPGVEAFERAISEYCGAPYAVAFDNATSAMHACYFAAGLTPLDRVLTTPISFVGTITGALVMGAQVQFVDVEYPGGLMNPAQLSTHPLAPRSRGRTFYVPVHFRGAPIDMTRLGEAITEPNAIVIEDAAQALGAHYENGAPVGCCQESDMTVFSLHPAKSITSAEGGMVLTGDALLAARLRQFRHNGIQKSDGGDPHLYSVEFATGNFHMSDLHAALGRSQLNKLDQFISRRRELVGHYRNRLNGLGDVTLPSGSEDDRSAHHLFTICVDWDKYGKDRATVMRELFTRGIGTQVHYIPLYRHPAVKKQCTGADCPQAEKYYQQTLSLPLYFDLQMTDIDRVVATLQELLIT